MTSFDWIRYAIAFLVVVTGPGSAAFWFAIHPFATFWRRAGTVWAYIAGFGVYAVSAVVLFALSPALLSLDWGTNVFTIVPGVAFVAVAVVLRRQWRRHLTMPVLFGAPEVGAGSPGKLLTDGIYAYVRHPRYLEVILAFLGYSLVCNYPAAYGATVFTACEIAVLIPLEERELAARFGDAYREYRRRVPAIVPRWGRHDIPPAGAGSPGSTIEPVPPATRM